MKILYDYQAFEMQNFGGVSRCFAELAYELNSLGEDCSIGVKESSNVHLIEKGFGKEIKPRYYKHNKVFGRKQHFPGEYRIKEKLIKLLNYSITPNIDYCIELLKKQDFDIFEPTYFNSYFLEHIGNKPFVLTVHDLIPELFQEYYSRDDFQIKQRKLLAPLAAHIHVPSLCTKNDLANLLNIDPEKISVIPHGSPLPPIKSKNTPSIVEYPYLLFVGARWAYKNFLPLLRVFKSIVSDYPELKLICTGSQFTNEEMNEISSMGLTDSIEHIFADDDTLANLYSNAIAFVYPSAYEGFGIPILEAFANDCPVLLNNASCFPEIAGDAATYFTLGAKSDFYDVFKTLYESSSDYRASLIQRGRRRLDIYSWRKSAEQLQRVYQSVL